MNHKTYEVFCTTKEFASHLHACGVCVACFKFSILTLSTDAEASLKTVCEAQHRSRKKTLANGFLDASLSIITVHHPAEDSIHQDGLVKYQLLPLQSIYYLRCSPKNYSR